MNVQVLVYIYLVISASMIVFNLIYVFLYNSDDGMYRRRSKSINKMITDQVLQVERGEDLSDKQKKKIKKKCQNMWYLDAWDDRLTVLSLEHEEAVKKYVLILTDMFRQLTVEMKRKTPVQQAHFAYVVCKYAIAGNDPGGTVISYILTLVQSPNLYCRENAMKVLYAHGDEGRVIQALDYISDSGAFHHEKLLVDGLLTFCGDHDLLMKKLVEDLEYKSLFMKQVILNYIRFGSGNFKDLFWEILQNEQEEDEIRFIAIRYFGRYPDERAKALLHEYAKNADARRWEYAAIAATALGSYPGEETIQILKNCLTDRNWYIRYNAALSLERLNLSLGESEDILNGEDRYAKEVLEYRIRMQQYEKENKEAIECQQK